MLKQWKFWLGLILLIGLVWLIESEFGWSSLLSSWNAIPTSAIATALVLMLASYLLRAVRFYDFFIDPCHGQFWLLLRITVLHNFFNNLLPMRSGEVAFPMLMKRHFELRVTHSAPALLWLRLLDLYALVVLAGISLQSQLSIDATTQWLISGALLCAPLILLPLQNHIHSYLTSHSHKGLQKVADLMEALPKSPLAFSRALLWTFTNWALKLAVYAWLLSQFVVLSWPQAWTGVSGGELSSVLPIHGFAGAGTYEAGVVAGLLPWSVDTKAVLAGAVNLHLFILGSTLILTTMIALLTHRLSTQPNSRAS